MFTVSLFLKTLRLRLFAETAPTCSAGETAADGWPRIRSWKKKKRKESRVLWQWLLTYWPLDFLFGLSCRRRWSTWRATWRSCTTASWDGPTSTREPWSRYTRRQTGSDPLPRPLPARWLLPDLVRLLTRLSLCVCVCVCVGCQNEQLQLKVIQEKDLNDQLETDKVAMDRQVLAAFLENAWRWMNCFSF